MVCVCVLCVCCVCVTDSVCGLTLCVCVCVCVNHLLFCRLLLVGDSLVGLPEVSTDDENL